MFTLVALLAATFGNAEPPNATSALEPVMPLDADRTTGDVGWQSLKVGGGGFVTGIDIDPTGRTYVVRTDTSGAYVSDGSGPWTQVVTATSMPASFISSMTTGTVQHIGQGTYEIRVAPSNPNRLFMQYLGTIYRSDNRGGTWTVASTGYTAGAVDANDSRRTYGQKMAVDPVNADHVLAGAAGGLYRSTNAGVTWSLVGGMVAPYPKTAGVLAIAFDASSGVSAGNTIVAYACVPGTGVYRTVDAGATWTFTARGPTDCSGASVASDGSYYVAPHDSHLWKYASGAWTDLTRGFNRWRIVSISVDPSNPARIVVSSDGGGLCVSTDRGSSWACETSHTRVATDIPWLAATFEKYMSSAAILFDPVTSNKLWFAEGIGVWTTSPSNTAQATTWTSHTLGIESLTALDVLVPPGSSYVFTADMDRAVFRQFRSNNAYPSAQATNMGAAVAITGGWALDYCKTNSAQIVAVINGMQGGPLSGYSLDSGATWAKFRTQPGTAAQGGDILCGATIDNIIYVDPGHGHAAWRSTDRGASWRQLASVPMGLIGSWVIRKHILAADGAYNGTSNQTLYLYAAGSGTWRSKDDGVTWSRMSTTLASWDYWHTKLRSAPGQAGHLFMASGHQGGDGAQNPSAARLMRSVDGGANWTTVAAIAEPYDVAIGKEAQGHKYPAIYVVGWHSATGSAPWTFGIWRSNDSAATWHQIGPFPMNWLGTIGTMSAASDVYGELYVSLSGAGWAKHADPVGSLSTAYAIGHFVPRFSIVAPGVVGISTISGAATYWCSTGATACEPTRTTATRYASPVTVNSGDVVCARTWKGKKQYPKACATYTAQ